MRPPALTFEECLARADEMEGLAHAERPEIRDSYLRMAAEWRVLAAQAAWYGGLHHSKPKRRGQGASSA